jgi:hypothetical protein
MPYIGKEPADIIATAVDTTTGDFSGNVTAGGTLAVTGETTLSTHLNLGDNDKIKLGASGDLEIFHDGSKSVISDEGTGVLWIAGDSEVSIGNPAVTEYYIRAFKDGAVQLMHDNSTKFATSSGGVTVTGDIANASGDLTLDVDGDITLDADGQQIFLKNGGTHFGTLLTNATPQHFYIDSAISDGDLIFRGNDGGSTVTALTLDMSDAGKATFNNTIDVTGNESDFTASSVNAPSGGNGIINLKAATARSSGFGPYIGFHVPNSTGGTTTEDMGVIGFVSPDSTDGNRKADFIVRTRNTTTGERFRISAAGNVGMGDQTTPFSTDATLNVDQLGSGFPILCHRDGTGDGVQISFRNDNGQVGRINTSGSSTSYVTSSDYRLKENLEYSFDATTRLKKLKPCRFNFKNNADTTVDGFIAHEVSDIVPEAITGEKDAMQVETRYTEDDVETQGDNPTKKVGDVKKYSTTEISPQGIDQSKLVPLLVKSLQEALAEIDTLKTKVAALESK